MNYVTFVDECLRRHNLCSGIQLGGISFEILPHETSGLNLELWFEGRQIHTQHFGTPAGAEYSEEALLAAHREAFQTGDRWDNAVRALPALGSTVWFVLHDQVRRGQVVEVNRPGQPMAYACVGVACLEHDGRRSEPASTTTLHGINPAILRDANHWYATQEEARAFVGVS